MSRRSDREEALKLLYEYSFHGDRKADDFLAQSELNNESEYSFFAKEAFIGVINAESEIDREIAELSKGWKLSRISKVALSILRLAAYEILFTETPGKVVINEALELSKIYDEPKSTGFINGILNNLAKKEDRLNSSASE